MKVVIIEDEKMMAEDLAEVIKQTRSDIVILEIISSVKEATAYFKKKEWPDLIFCDIQLGDGYSFDIFKKVKLNVPVIFCTAYDQYALEAFQNFGIGYILKPFTKATVKDALDKYFLLARKSDKQTIDYENIFSNLQKKIFQEKATSSLLVNWKDKIIPVRIKEIALFYIDYKLVQLVTFNGQKYTLSQTLDELEEICGSHFFRANRQYLVNKDSILEVFHFFARKLLLKLRIEGKYEIIVSKSKAPELLDWLRNN